MRKAITVWTLVSLVLLSVPAPPPEAIAAEAGSVLEEILNIMRQSGQITEEQRQALLERARREAEQAKAASQQAAAKAAPPTPAAPATGITAGIENLRPFLQSTDGNVRVELGGRLHFDYDAAEDTARTLGGARLTDQFQVRRARLELRASFFKWVELLVECEFTRADQKNGFCLNDAYLDLRAMPELGLRVGQFKEPFSFEELTSENTIDFVERSIVNDLAPGRDFGVVLRGSLFSGIVGYDVGVFNGAPFQNAGANQNDTNSAKDLAGRLTVAPFKPGGSYWLKGLQVGGSFTWGDGGEALSPQGRTSARTANRFTYFAQQPVRGDRTRWGTDLAWAVGPASLKFEYAEQRMERTQCGSVTGSGGSLTCAGGGNLADLVAAGWYVTGTWVLTGEDKELSGVVIPRRPFNPLTREYGPGAWELALRYAELSFESDDPVDFFDGNVTNGITGGGRTAENGVEALTAGINWYLNARLRYMVNWTQYWYDNPRGTPFSCGQPACSAGQVRRVDDPTSWELLTRLQIYF
jgi:phosphate-selective porin OprO/OprP